MPLTVAPDSSPTGTTPLAGKSKETSPAFQGASRAFNANVTASATSVIGANGAFAAASAASGGRGQTQTYNEGRLSISRQNTGQSIRSRDVSPSHLAANFAASQASNRLSLSQSVRRPSPLQRLSTGPIDLGQQDGDLPSPPATKSLVQLYESKQGPGLQKTQSVRYVSKPGPPIRSPKPVRPIPKLVPTSSSSDTISSELQVPVTQIQPQAMLDGTAASQVVAPTADSRPIEPVNQTMVDTQGPEAKREPPQAPPPRRQKQETTGNPHKGLEQSLKRTEPSTDSSLPRTRPPPDVSKSPKAMSTIYPKPTYPSSGTTLPSPLSRSTNPSASPARLKTTLSKPPPQPIPRQPSKDSTPSLSTHSLTTHLSIDSLANAMVASTLASSRNPSPTKSLPPPPPPRRHHHHSLFHHSRPPASTSRTPSPPKPPPMLRRTMRTHHSSSALSSDDDDSYKRGKSHHLVRKHQHKHHEGDRKRYRTQVTERERKRYEGVWAANKGLLLLPPLTSTSTTNLTPQPSLSPAPSFSSTSLDPSPFPIPISQTTTPPEPPPLADPQHPSNTVLNLIARDIFRRSRLPDDVLEEVWSLATSGEVGVDRLGREEFVVGMWLVDQRLRGNKLPVRVGESVWGSVRRLGGVRVGGRGKGKG